MRFSLLAVALAATTACATTTDPTAELARLGASELSIVPEKSSYTWSEVSSGGSGITAVVTNNGTQTAYARMGDAFNSADEQEVIYAALGSDGKVELEAGSSWTTLPTGILIEGVKTITLKPGKSYRLHASLQGPQVTGTARIRIVWFTDADDVGSTNSNESYSETFEIR